MAWGPLGPHRVPSPPSLIMGSTVRVDHSTHQDYGPSFEGPSSNRKRNGTFSETPFPSSKKSIFSYKNRFRKNPFKKWKIHLFYQKSICFMGIPFILWEFHLFYGKSVFLNRFLLMTSSGFGHVFPTQENGNSI